MLAYRSRWLTVMAVLLLPLLAVGQEATKPGPTVGDDLALRQSQLADKYTRLEDLMFKLSALEAGNNPKRAALLQRAVQQSKDRLTKTQLEAVSQWLQDNQLKRAVDGQATVQTDLKSLLELLMSEDRSERLKSEQQRIKEYIKEVERLIRLEKSLQGQTEGETDTKKLAEEQKNIAGRTGELAKTIQKNEENKDGKLPMGDEKPGEQKPGDMKPGDMPDPDKKPGDTKPGDKPGDMKPSENKPGDEPKKPDDPKPGDPEKKPGEEPKPGENKPTENKPGEQKPNESKPSESKPAESKPNEGKPMPGDMNKPGENQPDNKPQQNQPQDQQDNPARKRLEQAQQSMKDAQKKLEEAKRKESLADQQKAREELERAKAELEQILRQLREEEKERALAALEVRFRKMLEMQLKVYEATRRLDQVPADNRNNEFVVQAGKLSFDERKISLEAQKALTLLTEEGSSVAFPASVEQLKEDIDQVTQRLGDAKIDDVTTGIEEDIIAALEELIEAIQQAQDDLEKKKQQDQQQQQQQQEQEDALVDQIAELKMIRALQERVNKRTNRYAKLLKDDEDPIGQAESADLADAIRKLGDRQSEIRRITRDIVVGKNK